VYEPIRANWIRVENRSLHVNVEEPSNTGRVLHCVTLFVGDVDMIESIARDVS